MLGGGLPDKSVVVMTGEPGSGYDILAQQIMYQHALRNERVAYFSTSRSPDTIKEDFSTFGWDIAPLQEKGNCWLKTFPKLSPKGGGLFSTRFPT